jgi:pimeloyl-ACP methyl ester carboxylesterase
MRHIVRLVASKIPMFLESLIPERDTGKTPFLLVHGGAHTGACFLATAGGDPGWAHHFVAAGHPVHILDWPGAGRSGPAPLDLDGETLCRFLGEALETINEASVLVTHSMSGAYGWRLLESHGQLVHRLVAIAPAPPGNIQPRPELLAESEVMVTVRGTALDISFPLDRPFLLPRQFAVNKLLGNTTRFPMAVLDTYIASLQPLLPKLLYERQNVRGSQLCIRDFTHFAGKEILVVTGSDDTDHPRHLEAATVAWLAQCGARPEFRFLPELGISGNGHMLMLEDNAGDTARLILDWVGGDPARLAGD